jgi:predicted amidophosphoribosyltransferase
MVAQGLFAALFPSDCRLCGAPLVNISRLPVCLECISALLPIRVGTCEICGEGMATLARPEEIQTCDACRETRPQFEKACAYGSYDGELRELIHLLKYEQVTPAAKVLGTILAAAIAKLEISRPVLVIPVPLHSSKRRQRRFNQAELIARAALETDGYARRRTGHEFARPPAGYGFADRTDSSATRGKYSRGVSGGASGKNRGPQHLTRRRRVDDRHHGVRVRSGLAKSGRGEGLGCDRGAYFEALGEEHERRCHQRSGFRSRGAGIVELRNRKWPHTGTTR